MLFNVALMLSDRAPSVTRRILGGFQRRLSERIDAGGKIHLAADEHLPESDAMVHIGVWAVAVILVGLTVWSWRGLALTAIVVFATSVATEIGQGRFSQTRSVEGGDIVANAIGTMVGVAVTACAYLAWSSAAALISRSRHTAHR